MPAPNTLVWCNHTHGRLLRCKWTSETTLREYLCFSIRQEKVRSTFVFRRTSAIHHELHLNLHFLGIILPLDALQMVQGNLKVTIRRGISRVEQERIKPPAGRWFQRNPAWETDCWCRRSEGQSAASEQEAGPWLELPLLDSTAWAGCRSGESSASLEFHRGGRQPDPEGADEPWMLPGRRVEKMDYTLQCTKKNVCDFYGEPNLCKKMIVMYFERQKSHQRKKM